MPSVSTKLVAKYRKVITEKVVIFDDSRSISSSQEKPSTDSMFYEVDLSEIYDAGVREIKISTHYRAYHTFYYISSNRPAYTNMKWYSQNSVSDAYNVWQYSDKHTQREAWISCTHTTNLALNQQHLYVALFKTDEGNTNYKGYWTDFWIEVEYPDMSQLY